MAGIFNHKQRQRSILIVDDEEIIRHLCAAALPEYQTFEASNGQEAVDILARETIDLVLSDVMMPGMNGLDLLEGIKHRAPNQLVVMMTGFGDKDVILKALKAGADEFIHKPINLLQLKTTLAKTLEKKALQEEVVQLKRMDRLKSDFLGLVSHKLKTPITVISLFLQNLAHDTDCVHEPGFEKNLQLILEESGHLSSLIHDLLNFSNIILSDSSSKSELIDPRLLANECLQELLELARRRSARVECSFADQLPELLVDRKKIMFTLRAIIENAIKFTTEGSQVELQVESDSRDVSFKVSDQGPGIPAEELPKVFERFYQIDPDNTGQVRGFGLGLFYARQFAHEHHGSLELQSRPGAGTTVTLRLPLPNSR